MRGWIIDAPWASSASPAAVTLLLVACVAAARSRTAGPSAAGSVATRACRRRHRRRHRPAESDAPASPSGSVPTSAPPSAAAVRVEFLEAVGTKRWGDKPFTVKAKADHGAALVFAASGDCAVAKASGRVEIEGAGSCTITAQTATGDPASASLTFKIARAKPKITLGQDRALDAGLCLLTGGEGGPQDRSQVHARRGRIERRLPDRRRSSTLDGRQPSLRADCRVRVTAAKTSPDYDPPKPVTATIHVDFPAWEVERNTTSRGLRGRWRGGHGRRAPSAPATRWVISRWNRRA